MNFLFWIAMVAFLGYVLYRHWIKKVPSPDPMAIPGDDFGRQAYVFYVASVLLLTLTLPLQGEVDFHWPRLPHASGKSTTWREAFSRIDVSCVGAFNGEPLPICHPIKR